MQMSKITIKTIAQKANVSVGTVDRALNNRGRIKEETCRRIQQIAEELGYRPNKAASALARHHSLRIAAITPKNPGFFYCYIRDGFDDAILDVRDYGVHVESFLCNSLRFEDQVGILENLDVSRYDGVVLNAGSDDLTPYINRIVDAGVPVVTFNSDAVSSKRLFFVGEDPNKSGHLAGDMMGRLLHNGGRVAILSSFFHPGAAIDRINGFCDALRQYPNIDIVGQWQYRDDEDTAYEFCRQLLAQYPDIDGIFSNSATGSVATGRYMEEFYSQKNKRPLLIGYDVSDAVERYLKRGLFDMVIDQQPRRQSYYAIIFLFKYLTEQWTPDTSNLEICVNMVMRYNAEDHAMKRIVKNNLLL